MASAPIDDDEPLELTPDMEAGDPPADPPEAGEDDGETVVTFDDQPVGEDDQPADNSVIRRMREELREAKRETAELRKQAAPAPVEIGDKPTLAACDFDEERFETELDGWKDRKRQADDQATTAQREQQAVNESWDVARKRYDDNKAKLGVADFDDAETIVGDALGRNGPVILKAASNPALVMYALGKSPAKLAELAKIKDPFELAAAVARMEGSISMTRRSGPKPDVPASGSGAMPGGTDKQLEKLQKDADRTGNRDPLLEYKRKLATKK